MNHRYLKVIAVMLAGMAGSGMAQDRGAGNSFSSTLPPALASVRQTAGGACYLDSVNNAVTGAQPSLARRGSALAMGGWAVADMQAGKLGSVLLVQLRGKQTYYLAAESYMRPGLGKALGNPSLDGGGLKVAGATLNVPQDQYRISFLIRSANELLRCDTGQALTVE